MYEQRTPTMISPNPKQRVNVYRNLQKKMWSVRQGGRVIFHCNRIILKDVKFFVQAAGRARVLREKRKNVHAYVSGYLSNVKEVNKYPDNDNWAEVTYDPYKHETFIKIDSGNAIESADFVDMDLRYSDITPVLAIWKEK